MAGGYILFCRCEVCCRDDDDDPYILTPVSHLLTDDETNTLGSALARECCRGCRYCQGGPASSDPLSCWFESEERFAQNKSRRLALRAEWWINHDSRSPKLRGLEAYSQAVVSGILADRDAKLARSLRQLEDALANCRLDDGDGCAAEPNIEPRPAELPKAAAVAHDTERKRAIDRDEANLRAREALRGRPPQGKTRWTCRTLAKAIGCSSGLAAILPAFSAYREEHATKSRRGLSRAVSLTEGVLANEGRTDETLAALIAEQQADFEESPLVSRGRTRRGRRPKL